MASTFAQARSKTPKDPAAVEELRSAIRDLPPESQDQVDRAMAEAAIEYRETGDMTSMRLFVESLLITARLHRNPDYRKALAEAETDDWTSGVEAADLISAARAQRARRG
jgi:hypothetical protein